MSETQEPIASTASPASPTAPARGPMPADVRRARARRWMRRGVAVLLALALGAVLVLALQTPPVAVDVQTADRGVVELTVDEPGRTRVIDRYVVSAPLTGNLARLEIHASDVVAEGQAVARILPLAPPLLDARTRSSTEEQLAAARARRDQARSSLAHGRELLAFSERDAERQRRLGEQGTITGRELDVAEMGLRTRASEVTSLEFALRVAEHEVQLAQDTLGRSDARSSTVAAVEVTSPVAGVVLGVTRESEGVIQAGQAILEVGDDGALEIVTDVLTSDAVRIAPGALVRLDGWGGDGLEGRVRVVEHAARTHVSALGVEEQRADVIIALTSERDRWQSLGDGYRVETHIVVERRESALRVPISAVFRDGEGWATYVVRANVVRLVPLELGLRSRDVAEVLHGLDEGDRVVVYPSERVVDGVEVVARQE